MSYNNSHRALLQAIMQRGAVSDTEAREMVVKLFQQNESTQSYMHQINVKLEPLNMELKNVVCEVTGKKYWILVSTFLDATARLQTEFSAAQLELLRKILSELVTSVDGCLTSTMCLNLCSTLENKMSKADADEFLTNMVEKKWFVDQHGKFYIGVRSIAELIPYFRNTYGGDVIHTCSLCLQTVFHGEKCIHCQEVLHRHCFANCALVQNPPKCPTCGEIMTTENIQDYEGLNDRSLDLPTLGEDSVHDNDNDDGRIRSTRKRKQTSR